MRRRGRPIPRPSLLVPAFRFFPFLAGLLVLGLGLVGGCPSPEEPRRIGVLCGLDFLQPLITGFQGRMTELGYVEGQDVVYVIETTNYEPARERAILESFVNQGVDLVLVFPTEASMLAKSVLSASTTPMVFAYASVEGTGLIESVRHPGGNVTGVRYPDPDIAVQRLEVLRPVAESRGVRLVELPAADADDLARGLAGLPPEDREAIDAILVIVEPLAVTQSAFAVLAEFGRTRGILCGGALMSAGDYASVFSANSDIVDTGRQAAAQVDRVLSGRTVGDIPVVSAERCLEVDYRAARRLGLDVPDGLLSRANRIRR